jgi:hypothetical protein
MADLFEMSEILKKIFAFLILSRKFSSLLQFYALFFNKKSPRIYKKS